MIGGELSSCTGTVNLVRHQGGPSTHVTPESEPTLAVSKRLRHEIFRRDNHTCQSCGAKAPDVKLEPDHVVPVALGGSDDPSNLRTLCTDCNAGKSATPPDAATVAKVADDAARWSQAIQAAADHMLGDTKVRDEARAAFDARWRAWSEGRPALPRPMGWEMSVDQFLKAGLPLPSLLDCVDIAMRSRNVKPDDLFKYMCGVAWKEVRKLQKSAHAALAHLPAGTVRDASDDVVGPWEGVVADLLESLTPDERLSIVSDESEAVSLELNEDGRYPLAAAFDELLSDLRSDLWSLSHSVDALLRALPDGVGERAMKIAGRRMYDSLSTDLITRHRFAEWAINVAVRLYAIRDANEYLDRLPEGHRQAWLDYAEAVRGAHAEGWGYGPWQNVGEGHRTLYAADHARSAEEVTPDGMCQGPGDLIAACARPAAFLALLEDETCCDGQTLATHGHPICETHLAALVDCSFLTPDGEFRAIRDFAEYVMPSREEPPF
jgi:hypothetical protein